MYQIIDFHGSHNLVAVHCRPFTTTWGVFEAYAVFLDRILWLRIAILQYMKEQPRVLVMDYRCYILIEIATSSTDK